MSLISKSICLFKTKPALLALIFSGVSLIGAYASQYLGGLHPCDLCWTQRYVHMAILAFAVLALAVKPLQKTFTYGAILSTMASTVLAAYHAGIEYKWWQGITTCSSSDMSGLSIEEMMERINNAPLMRCDEVPWEIFNISMAGFNAIFSALAAMMLLWLIRPKTS
jgi:disulfide bond formation protein DsbB